MFLLKSLNGLVSEKLYRIHVSFMRTQGQCHEFMPSLEVYSINSGNILTLVKENAKDTCTWPFMVPVIGIMTFPLSKQRNGWMPCYSSPFQQYFSYDMTMDGRLKGWVQ